MTFGLLLSILHALMIRQYLSGCQMNRDLIVFSFFVSLLELVAWFFVVTIFAEIIENSEGAWG